jgi:hypothetical protein
MFENELETLASGIGSQTIVVRRANIRFAPTLVSDIGWISITTIYPKIYDRLLILIRTFGAKDSNKLSLAETMIMAKNEHVMLFSEHS